MTVLNTPVTRTPMSGFGEAAADDGREYWYAASTRTTTFAATSGNFGVDDIFEHAVQIIDSSRLDEHVRRRFCRGRGERENNDAVALTASSEDVVIVSCQ